MYGPQEDFLKLSSETSEMMRGYREAPSEQEIAEIINELFIN